jgi:hypothetical protein
VRTPDTKLIRTQPLAAPKGGKNLAADRFERLSRVGAKRAIGWVELYDLESDPGERENLASARPGRVMSLEREIRTWVKACGYVPHGSWP